MNVFYLDPDPEVAARYHVDKHVVKMILEYAQLLSSAHRLLDGRVVPVGTRKVRLLGEEMASLVDGKVVIGEPLCYRETHVNHPSAIWARESVPQYHWLFRLFRALLAEYTHRYGRQHSTERLVDFLHLHPLRLESWTWREPPQAMPDECKLPDTVEAYRNYYRLRKASFAKWKNRPVPDWFAAKYP